MLRASPSMSSAMMISGFLCVLASSRAGMIDWTVEIFFSQNRIRASWNSLLAPDGENTDIHNLTQEGSAILRWKETQSYARKIRNIRKKEAQSSQCYARKIRNLRKKEAQSYARKIRNLTQESFAVFRKKTSKIRNVSQERFAMLRKKDLQCYARKICNLTQERFVILCKKDLQP